MVQWSFLRLSGKKLASTRHTFFALSTICIANKVAQLNILNKDELKHAKEALWKVAQEDCFHEEIKLLFPTRGSPEIRHACVSRPSPLFNVWSYLDNQEILRMRS